MSLVKPFLASVLSCALLLAASGCDNQEVQATSPPAIQPAQLTAEQLQQLVAPIALYPDELVAEILAASTYPTQIVEAERWLQQNSSLKGAQVAGEVNKQSWDPSVKALTQFPSVLANMDKNLSWTSALGDAYFNNQQDVLTAVQVMRKRAQDAGTLKSTAQQNVATQGQTIIIQPTNPDIVYLPQYDPNTHKNLSAMRGNTMVCIGRRDVANPKALSVHFWPTPMLTPSTRTQTWEPSRFMATISGS